MQTKKFILIDSQTSPELKAAYQAAIRNKTAVHRAFRVVNALHALIEEAGFQNEMANAVQQALATGADVADVLHQREVSLHEQIALAQADMRAYKAACEQRMAEVRQVVNGCIHESFRLSDEIKDLQKQIDQFGTSRAQATEKYKAAGLTDADVAAIGGIKPTHGDLAEWKILLEEKQARQEQIARFLKSSPDFDLSLLDSATAGA